MSIFKESYTKNFPLAKKYFFLSRESVLEFNVEGTRYNLKVVQFYFESVRIVRKSLIFREKSPIRRQNGVN